MGIVILLYINAFLGSFSANIMNVALYDVMAEYGVSSTTVQWLISGFMIVTVILVTSMAFIYRHFGTRRIFFAAQCCFIVSCAVGLLAPNFALLMVARLVQGVGTGLSMPLMMNVVLAVTPPEHRGFRLGIGSCIITLGPAFAPVVSGVFVTFLGWHSVFMLPLLVSIAVALAGLKVMRDVNETGETTLDIPSAILLAAGLFFFALGLTRLVSETLLALGLLAVGVVVLAFFAWRQGRTPEPFLDLSPLRSNKFWPACIMVLIVLMTTFSLSVLLPLYYESACAMTALMAGGLMLVPVLVNSVTGVFAGSLMDRFGEWPLIPIGFLCIVVGQIAIVYAASSAAVVVIVLAAACAYGGVGLASSPSQVAGLGKLDPVEYPHGVSIVTALIQSAGCIAPSLFVGIISSVESMQVAAGASLASAGASGLSVAMGVGAALSVAGLVVSTVYALAMRK